MIKWPWVSRKKYDEVLERERANETYYKSRIAGIYDRWNQNDSEYRDKIREMKAQIDGLEAYIKMYQEAISSYNQENSKLRRELDDCWKFINTNHSNKHHSLKQKRVQGKFAK